MSTPCIATGAKNQPKLNTMWVAQNPYVHPNQMLNN